MSKHSGETFGRRFKMAQSTGAACARMKHAGTRRLFEYWTDLTGARPAPYRSEVTATGLGRDVASSTFVMENLGAGNIRFRVAGSGLRDLFGLDPRGMSALSIFSAPDKPKFRALAEAVLSRPCVGLATCAAVSPEGEEVEIEALITPLRSDFDEMDRLLGSFHVIGAPPVAPTLRRCRIISAHTLRLEMEGPAELGGPLPGFGEPETGFQGRPQLTTIEGGGGGEAAPRRGHLRVVTEDWSDAE